METEIEQEREEAKQELARHRGEVSAIRVQISKLNEEHKQAAPTRQRLGNDPKAHNERFAARTFCQDRVDASRTELSKAKAQAEQDILSLAQSCDRKVSKLQGKLSQAGKRQSAYEKAQATYTDESVHAQLDDAR